MRVFNVSSVTTHNRYANSPSIDNQKVRQNISFEGLTKVFAHKIYIDGQRDIERILAEKPNVNPVVGQLPGYIFKLLPAEKRPEAIREILKTFDDVAFAIRNFESSVTNSIDEIKNQRPKEVNTMLTNVFRKYNVLSKFDDDINVRYLDKGGKGKVFKIEGLRDYMGPDEDEFVIKVFHQIKGKSWQPYKSHGCYAEINNGLYWNKQEGKDTQRGKFFFASMKSGYIVSKFIDLDVRLPKRIVPEYKYGIKCTDEAKDVVFDGYNCLKGYNYDYGGMRIVNAVKNSDKIARYYLEGIKKLSPSERIVYWFKNFNTHENRENCISGLAMGIKYLNNKNFYIDTCIKLHMPKVDQALGYVLKYLPFDDGLRYFEKLVQTKDVETQRVLFNEIPLLAKFKDKNIPIVDDISASLKEIIPDRLAAYYLLAEKYALPETIEHLGSYVHMLPKDMFREQYQNLVNIKNYNLQDRLVWKLKFVPDEHKEFAVQKLVETVDDPTLMELLEETVDSYPKLYEKFTAKLKAKNEGLSSSNL